MPDPAIHELARVLGVVAHPDRIRIVEEIGQGERDVSSLCEALGLRQARVSQHLALLRSHHLVEGRREGRHVYYSLTCTKLAPWLIEGLACLEPEVALSSDLVVSMARMRARYGHDEE